MPPRFRVYYVERVVKLLLMVRVGACGPRVLRAVQGVARSRRHTGSVHTLFGDPSAVSHAGPGVSRGSNPVLAFYPSTSDATASQRRCSLDPDT
jgi:hypothetical protein